MEVYVLKKSGEKQLWDDQKIKDATQKSADRIGETFTDSQKDDLLEYVHDILEDKIDKYQTGEDTYTIPIAMVHSAVEIGLDMVSPPIASSYRDYRNWVKHNAAMMQQIWQKGQAILNRGDSSNNEAVDNANADASLCSTQGAKIRDYLLTAQYEEYFLTKKEREAAADGYIYIHDKNLRQLTFNCDLLDVSKILKGGFEMGNIWYNEPKRLATCFEVMGDIVLSAASQQYGGLTIPRVDAILEEYAEKSYQKYIEEFENLTKKQVPYHEAEKYAYNKVVKDFEQGFQGWEYKFNTVASSRGDYPFISVTFGLQNTKWGKECCKAILKVRKNGQGKEGYKKPVLFPKLIFLYDKNLHGDGAPTEDVFDAAIDCSSKCMYPDYLSLTGEGYISDMYKKYGAVISPMGCIEGGSTLPVWTNGEEQLWTIKELFEDAKGCFGDNKRNRVNITESDLGTEIWILNKNKNDVPLYAAWDTALDKQTAITRIIKRNAKYNKWLNVTVADSRKKSLTVLHLLTVTTDHPFEIKNRGVVLAKDLQIGDRILVHASEYCDKEDPYGYIESITPSDYVGDAYDITTESEHFEFSGVYSHNCRAFLSPWYERGGMNPADEDDKPIFEGRFNIGVVSLNLPMIYAKSQHEGTDFYEELDYYLEMIRGIHLRTYDYLGNKKASINPLGFCEGGFLGGNLGLNDKIAPLLPAMTASFGITALNELNILHNGKTIREDGEFPLEVMKYINDKVASFKEADHRLYAIYGTPAEKLTETQVMQFRGKYGIVTGVSDRLYVSNSFHCHVTEDMSGVEKQDKEDRFWEYFNGGKIQYCRYNVSYNTKAMKTLVRRAMDMGLYEGINLSLAYCDDCGHEELEMDVCPKCGSKNLTKIDRMNGYLAYSRVHGDTRLNRGKMAEIADRKSM